MSGYRKRRLHAWQNALHAVTPTPIQQDIHDRREENGHFTLPAGAVLSINDMRDRMARVARRVLRQTKRRPPLALDRAGFSEWR